MALPLDVPAPSDNPTTRERAALGRLLFWDPILSGQRDVACATCHHPSFGYSDGLDLRSARMASGWERPGHLQKVTHLDR